MKNPQYIFFVLNLDSLSSNRVTIYMVDMTI